MMLYVEIYVDRIADMRIANMNAALEAVRQSVIQKKGNDQEDLYLHILGLTRVQENEYYVHVISEDLTGILRDIRDIHRKEQPQQIKTARPGCAETVAGRHGL